MNKKIIITEKQEQNLLEFLIMENEFTINPSKVLIIKKFLDDNFKRGSITKIGTNGLPINEPIVGMIKDGEVVKNLTAKQLFDLLEENFKNMFGNRIERSKFLSQVIKDWFYKRISKEGLLSVTHC